MLKSWLKLILLAVIWGSSYILMKRGLFDADGNAIFTGIQVGSLRIIFASLALLPFTAKALKNLTKKTALPILIAGLVGNGLPAILFAIAQTKTSSSLAGTLSSLTPLCALLVGVLFFKQPFKGKQTLGVALGFAGALGLVLQSVGSGPEGTSYFYAGLILLACLCYGISVNVIKHFLREVPPLQITSLGFLFILPVFLLSAFQTGVFSTITANPKAITAIPYIAVLGIVGTAFAVFIFNKLIKETSAVFASSVTYLIPIVSIFWGVLDGEAFTLTDGLFCGVILSGVYIINKSK